MPSTGSPYAKPVKNIFVAPSKYVYVGSDFASLEDRISALTTKDSNKLKVYTDGYDGHSLRASSYFASDMPDITEKISFAETGNKFYKVTLDDGSIEYLSDSDPRYKELINDD